MTNWQTHLKEIISLANGLYDKDVDVTWDVHEKLTEIKNNLRTIIKKKEKKDWRLNPYIGLIKEEGK